MATHAQNCFTKTGRIVAPIAPGDRAEIIARLLDQMLRNALGQTHIIDDLAGANGIIRREIAAKSPADGYTPFILSVHPLFPENSVNEMVALAKVRPSQLSYTTFGIGNSTQPAGGRTVLHVKRRQHDAHTLQRQRPGDGHELKPMGA